MGLIGGGVGVALALLVARAGRTLLFGVAGHEASIAAGAALLVLAMTIAAGVLPARRATLVDPALTPRAE